MVNHPSRWLRNLFRHYIQYLYHLRRTLPETYGWLMEVVPSRSYKLDVRLYPISLEDLERTSIYFRENHEIHYTLYRLMLEGGLRLSHAIHVLRTFVLDEVVEVPNVGLETRRLACFGTGASAGTT